MGFGDWAGGGGPIWPFLDPAGHGVEQLSPVYLVAGFEFRFRGFGFRNSSFEFRDLGVGFRVSDFSVFTSRVLILGSQFSGSGLFVSGEGLRVSALGFKLSVFEFRVLGSGFRVSGFGINLKGVESFRDSGVPFIANAVLEENASLRGSGLVLRARSTRPGSCERVRSSR